MVHFCPHTRDILNKSEGKESLRVILSISPLTSKEDIFRQFEELAPTGTRIIIWNLRHERKERDNEKVKEKEEMKEGGGEEVEGKKDEEEEERGECEFDFSDPMDVRIRDFSREKERLPGRGRGRGAGVGREKGVNKLEVSLRTYCTYLYLEPRMTIIIRSLAFSCSFP